MSSAVALVTGQMYVAQAILHLPDSPLQQRDGNVKGLPPQAVLCALDFGSTVLQLPPAYAMFPVIMPHMKQASSRAIAVLATFAFLPFDNTIL